MLILYSRDPVPAQSQLRIDFPHSTPTQAPNLKASPTPTPLAQTLPDRKESNTLF
jgi:hypothetical protein